MKRVWTMRREKALRTAALAGALALSRGALAGRPLTIDDADPVRPGQFEFEAGVGYEYELECKHWDFPFGLTCGLLAGLEAGVGFGGQFERRSELLEHSRNMDTRHESGIGDLAVGAKWQFIESCPLGARHALVPAVSLPTADEDRGLGSGETDCDLMWIASRAAGARAGLHINVGYSWIGGPDDDTLHYGAALDYRVAEALQWVGEVFAEKELADGTDTVVQYNTGLRWHAAESLALDLAGGSKISGDAPDWTALAGLTWAFELENQ